MLPLLDMISKHTLNPLPPLLKPPPHAAERVVPFHHQGKKLNPAVVLGVVPGPAPGYACGVPLLAAGGGVRLYLERVQNRVHLRELKQRRDNKRERILQ